MMENNLLSASDIVRERRKMELVSLISLELNKPLSLKEKLFNILQFLDTVFGLKHTMLLLPEDGQLMVFASRGFPAQGLGAKVTMGEGIIGVVGQRKKKLRLANISRNRQYVKTALGAEADPAALPGLPDVESQVAIPLLAGEKLIAVLSAESQFPNFFSLEDEDCLMTLSQIIGLSIQNSLIIENLETTVKERTYHLELQKQKLEQTNMSKDRLFSIISHDLRNPIASLQTISALMQYYHGRGETSQMIRIGERVVATAKNLNSLLDNLLTWSLTQTGQIKIKTERANLVGIIKDVVAAYDEGIKAKEIQPHFDFRSEEVMVETDVKACFSIFSNVLSNALKFSPANAPISIFVHTENGYVRVSVRDFGAGMSSKKAQDLLSNSVNKSERGTAKEKGTGIGLALAQELARLIKAQIVISSAPGEGTEVSMLFPL